VAVSGGHTSVQLTFAAMRHLSANAMVSIIREQAAMHHAGQYILRRLDAHRPDATPIVPGLFVLLPSKPFGVLFTGRDWLG
jgi:hypothetical protein